MATLQLKWLLNQQENMLKLRVSPVRIGFQYGLTTKNGGLNGGSTIKNRASTSKMGCLLKSWYLEKVRASNELVTVVNS